LAQTTPDPKPNRFIFLLLKEFTLLSFAGAVDCLRIANKISGKTFYQWEILGEQGECAQSSIGVMFPLDGGLRELSHNDTVLICGGMDIAENSTPKVIAWLRREARRGVRMGGLCTAAHTMAMAGLLNDKKATIHWENQDSFAEEFEDVELTKSVFTVDGNRITTAGGTSSIDMVLKLIADDLGE
jgi:transcriptional regulator GlxA family with amidase domain